MWIHLPETSSAFAVDTAASTSDLAWLELAPVPSVTWRGKPMPPRTWRRLCKPGSWMRHLSGLTLSPSTASHGVEQWISSLLDSRANPTASQASAKESRTPDGCGTTSRASSASASHTASSSRTSQGFSVLDSETSSETLPYWGSMRSGHVVPRPKPEPPTVVPASSCWPTPTAATYGSNIGGANGRVGKVRYSLYGLANRWPTHTAGDSKASGAAGYSTDSGRHSGTTLTDATVRLPEWRGHQAPTTPQDGASSSAKVGLNPRFVEMLMGLPPGWTDCACSVME